MGEGDRRAPAYLATQELHDDIGAPHPDTRVRRHITQIHTAGGTVRASRGGTAERSARAGAGVGVLVQTV
jgi:hypothetical protein